MKNSKVFLPALAISFALLGAFGTSFSKSKTMTVRPVVLIEAGCNQQGSCDDGMNTSPCVNSQSQRLKEKASEFSCSIPANGVYIP